MSVIMHTNILTFRDKMNFKDVSEASISVYHYFKLCKKTPSIEAGYLNNSYMLD